MVNFYPITQKSQKFVLWLVLSGNFWLESDKKFEEKLTGGLEMRNLANFHQSTWKSLNWDFDRILLSKVENIWAWNWQGSYV